jgi:hypothetical protein
MSDFSANDYLNSKVKIIYEPMITQMLVDKPNEPVNNKLINYLDSLHD